MPHVYPRYQPISESGGLSSPVQGYQDIQIDGETYFIAYMNYYSFSFGHGLPGDARDDKWLKGAQEYVAKILDQHVTELEKKGILPKGK
jgi:hypothetical protein